MLVVGCLYKLGVLPVGVPIIRAVLFCGVYQGHQFLETPSFALASLTYYSDRPTAETAATTAAAAHGGGECGVV